jgi:hypothetical protein
MLEIGQGTCKKATDIHRYDHRNHPRAFAGSPAGAALQTHAKIRQTRPGVFHRPDQQRSYSPGLAFFEPRVVGVPGPCGKSLAAGIPDLHRLTLSGKLETDPVGIRDWKDGPVGLDHLSILLIKIEETQVRKIRPTQVSPSNGEKRAPVGVVEEKSDPQGNLRSIAFQKPKKGKKYGNTSIRNRYTTQRASLAGCICPRTGRVSAHRSSSAETFVRRRGRFFRPTV